MLPKKIDNLEILVNRLNHSATSSNDDKDKVLISIDSID